MPVVGHLLRTLFAFLDPPVWQQLSNSCRSQQVPGTSRSRHWRRPPTALVSTRTALRLGVLGEQGHNFSVGRISQTQIVDRELLLFYILIYAEWVAHSMVQILEGLKGI